MARKLVGIVTSNVQDKTIVVTVRRSTRHPLYRKQVLVSKKFQAHDETNKANLGDRVEISETRPLSKTKHFKLSRVLEAGKVLEKSSEEDEE